MNQHLPYPRRTFSVEPDVLGSASGASAWRQVDLQSQLEELLHAVWKAEADWRFNDRLDMALKQGR